jgi:long-chain acyl-CoA synthetase
MIKENFIEYIGNSLVNNWDLPALTDYKGKCYKYKDVARRIKKLHILYEEAGIKKGDKISLLGKNSANWATTYLSIVTYGAVVVPILPDFLPNDIHHIVNHSDSKMLFVGDPIWENLDESCMPELSAIFSLTDFSLTISRSKHLTKSRESIDQLFTDKVGDTFNAEDFKIDPISNKEVGVLNYTSGTTGFSKGVILPLNSLAANIHYAWNNMPLEAGDSIVSFLPLAHTYGCAFEFLWPFSKGCHIHFLTRTPSPKIIIQAFQEVKPSIVITVPLIIEKIYKKQIMPLLDKNPLRTILKMPLLDKAIHSKIRNKLNEVFGGKFSEVVIGGAAISPEVEDFLTKINFRFSTGYGMTECGPLISYANWDKRKIRSVGKLVDSLDIRIDSKDPYNEVGEILVKGENLMHGYYKNKEATENALDNEGWLHTGDLGIIDKENNIFIKGRSKSLILGPSGENIYPEEIEAKYNNMPLVQESVVIDSDRKIVALIYPDYDMVDALGIIEKDLQTKLEEYRKEINKTLPKYMQISKVCIHPEEFEKTPKRSIKRYLYSVAE